MNLEILKLKPRHKWFSATSRFDEKWAGPHATFEAAAREAYADSSWENPEPVFVTQGYKMTKAEREEFGADFEWQCDTANAVEVRLKS